MVHRVGAELYAVPRHFQYLVEREMLAPALALCLRLRGGLADAGRDDKDSGLDAEALEDGKGVCIVVLPAVVKGQRDGLRWKLATLAEMLYQLRGRVEDEALFFEIS